MSMQFDIPAAIPGVPRAANEPVFGAPWQAQAFAIVLALHERGLFGWCEWAATLADEIKRAHAAGDPDQGDTYWRHWLAALERLVAEKGAAEARAVARYRAAWARAAARTPHGAPIALSAADFEETDRRQLPVPSGGAGMLSSRGCESSAAPG